MKNIDSESIGYCILNIKSEISFAREHHRFVVYCKNFGTE